MRVIMRSPAVANHSAESNLELVDALDKEWEEEQQQLQAEQTEKEKDDEKQRIEAIARHHRAEGGIPGTQPPHVRQVRRDGRSSEPGTENVLPAGQQNIVRSRSES